MTTYAYPVRSTTRAREHERINLALEALAAEFPHCTGAELIDCLATAQYDLGTARALIIQATLEGIQVCDYLARLDQAEEER